MLPFEVARTNFVTAARQGLAAEQTWLDGSEHTASALAVLPPPSWVTTRVAARPALPVGRKAMLTVQLAPAASEAPHVFVRVKSAGFAPANATPPIVMDAAPTLDKGLNDVHLQFHDFRARPFWIPFQPFQVPTDFSRWSRSSLDDS